MASLNRVATIASVNLALALDVDPALDDRPYQPEQAAVLIAAVDDYWHVAGHLAPNLRPQWQRQARAWFDSPDCHIGSFWWIAQVLNLDPCAVRSRIGDPRCRELLNTRFQQRGDGRVHAPTDNGHEMNGYGGQKKGPPRFSLEAP